MQTNMHTSSGKCMLQLSSAKCIFWILCVCWRAAPSGILKWGFCYLLLYVLAKTCAHTRVFFCVSTQSSAPAATAPLAAASSARAHVRVCVPALHARCSRTLRAGAFVCTGLYNYALNRGFAAHRHFGADPPAFAHRTMYTTMHATYLHELRRSALSNLVELFEPSIGRTGPFGEEDIIHYC